ANVFKAFAPDKQNALRQGLNSTTNIDDFENLVGQTPPEPGAGARVEAEPIPTLRFGLQLRLWTLEVFVTVVTLMFVIALGWLTLYVASNTFGSDPKDYITLFLFGSVTSGVLGKAVNFADLRSLVVTGS